MSSMPGPHNMTSSDWMLLALSAVGGTKQQMQLGRAFVQRMLEMGDLHPAVAILIGIGDLSEAIQVYTSRNYFMEAALLTCLLFPNDWQRISFIVRKWGEHAMSESEPELAVKCFSCTSMQPSGAWLLEKSQGKVSTEHGQQPTLSPSSVSSQSPRNRLTTKSAALKLITTFDSSGVTQLVSTTDGPTPVPAASETPIADTALSPGADWSSMAKCARRDPSSSRSAKTMTPGAYNTRLSSVGEGRSSSSNRRIADAAGERQVRPQGAGFGLAARRERSSSTRTKARSSSANHRQYEEVSSTRYPVDAQHRHCSVDGESQAVAAYESSESVKQYSDSRTASRGRRVGEPRSQSDVLDSSNSGLSTHERSFSGQHRDDTESEPGSVALSPPAKLSDQSPTASSIKNSTTRSIDQYINSLAEVTYNARQRRPDSRPRKGSRDARARSQSDRRGTPETRGLTGTLCSARETISQVPSLNVSRNSISGQV